jgi:2-dehydro-3-deoxyphosphogluconate aldolase/(4S)-4-hydroxy-2-oxoglutarate aldolase
VNALTVIAQAGLVPVIVIDSPGLAVQLGRALLEAGISCAEVTLRTPLALAALEALSGLDGLTVGAGTVTEPRQVSACHDAGARFVVSPGFDPDIHARCGERRLPYLPGAVTATEVQLARRAGLTALKFFPAETAGGLPAVRALTGPFPDVVFVPTGGIGPGNLARYLRCAAVLAVGGSWMASRDDIRNGEFARITELSAQALRLVAQARPTAAGHAPADPEGKLP